MHKGLIACGFLGLALGLGAFPLLRADDLPSRSVLETVPHPSDGSRIHLTPRQARRAVADGLVPPGTRSVLNLTRLRHGDYVWEDRGVASGRALIRVNLEQQLLSVFRNGHEIGVSVVIFGASGNDTPVGTFPILTKIRDHRSATYDAPMPFTLRLTGDGVAIHGGDVRWGAATHGCIGIPTEFARRLFEQVEVGDAVEVID